MPKKSVIQPKTPIAKKIVADLEERGWNRVEFANRVGVEKQTVSHWLTDKTRISHDNYIKVARVLGWSMGYEQAILAGYFRSGSGKDQGADKYIALMDLAGLAMQDLTFGGARPKGKPLGRVAVPGSVPDDSFAVDVPDNALSGHFAVGETTVGGFRAGDRVIVSPSISPQPGDIVVAIVGPKNNLRAVIRVYIRHGSVVSLIPTNSEFDTYSLIEKNGHNRVVGVVVRAILAMPAERRQ